MSWWLMLVGRYILPAYFIFHLKTVFQGKCLLQSAYCFTRTKFQGLVIRKPRKLRWCNWIAREQKQISWVELQSVQFSRLLSIMNHHTLWAADLSLFQACCRSIVARARMNLKILGQAQAAWRSGCKCMSVAMIWGELKSDRMTFPGLQ
jgi:hypothetical protein